MRNISSTLQQRLKEAQQTAYKNADPRAKISISRPQLPLTSDDFLEFTTVATLSGLQKADVAIRRMKAGKAADRAYMAYVADGTAGVKYAALKGAAPSQVWNNADFSEPAVDVAIAFDGTMPVTKQGNVQFVTEDSPWVFWSSDAGVLCARRLGSETTHTLADGNCTAVSAVRAMWSQVGGLDFGLVCFFLLNNVLYYRQYIDGVWTDAELVSFGPEGVTWSSIAAFRTWDYRIGVQALGSDGVVYEMFTQYMGISKLNAEHVAVTSASVTKSKLTGVSYLDAHAQDEHISVASAEAAMPYGGIYTTGTPFITAAYNISDDSGNWGKIVVFEFNKELDPDAVAADFDKFYFIDSAGAYWYPASAETDASGCKVILRFIDFNNAAVDCTACYDPGSVVTMAGTAVDSQRLAFALQNLVPLEGLPEVLSIWNE